MSSRSWHRWRGVAVLVTLVSIMLLGACAHTPGAAPGESGRVDAALQHYSRLVVAMDHAGIAALFAPDGEIVHELGPPTQGRAAIDSFLVGFAGYHVLENKLVATSTIVRGDSADQRGTYHQRVKPPTGDVIEVSGSFHARWLRTPGGEWQILRMGTASDATK